MSSRKILKSVIIVIACLIFLPLLLFAGLMIALTIPSVQQKAAMAAARILSARVKPFTFDRLTFPITDAVLKDADIVLGVKSKFFCNNFRKFNIQHISAI